MKMLYCFLAGVLATTIVGALAYNFQRDVELSDKQLNILVLEHGFVPAEVVDDIETIETALGPVKVTEEVVVTVEPEPVSVNPEIGTSATPTTVTVTEPCDYSPLQNLSIGGSSSMSIVGTGKKKAVRTSWSCKVEGNGWSAERGPVPGDDVDFKTLREAVEPRFRRDVWLGAIRSMDGTGPMTGVSFKGRKWGLGVGTGAVPVNGDTEALVFFGITRRW